MIGQTTDGLSVDEEVCEIYLVAQMRHLASHCLRVERDQSDRTSIRDTVVGRVYHGSHHVFPVFQSMSLDMIDKTFCLMIVLPDAICRAHP